MYPRTKIIPILKTSSVSEWGHGTAVVAQFLHISNKKNKKNFQTPYGFQSWFKVSKNSIYQNISISSTKQHQYRDIFSSFSSAGVNRELCGDPTLIKHNVIMT